jgi:RHS repeat-associated protein
MHKPPIEALVCGDSSRRRGFRRPLWPIIFAALPLLLGPNAVSLKAQQTSLEAIGIPPFTKLLPVENGYINPMNGDLHLEIPFTNIAERAGQQFKAALAYDSNIWSNTIGPFNVPGGSGPNSRSMGGWRLLTSAHSGGAQYSENDYYCRDGVTIYRSDFTNWYYVFPDGSARIFNSIRTTQYYAACGHSGTGGVPNGDQTSYDGYHLHVTNYTGATVYAPDGACVYGCNNPGPEDANGNYSVPTGIDYGNDIHALDMLGRSLVNSTTSGNYIYYDILNSQGTTSRYTVTTETIYANDGGSFADALTVIQSIQLPDGTSYSFQYDSGTTGNHYGTLTSMTMPTGGQINYSYATVNLNDGSGNRRLIASRLTPDSPSPWNYAYQSTTACVYPTQNGQYQLTVTKPSGDNDVYTFTIFWPNYCTSTVPTQLQIYSGSISAANLVATLTQSSGCGYVLISADTTTLPIPGGSGINQTNQYTWDCFTNGPNQGQLLQKQEWNFYTGSLPANPDRTTTYTYLNSSGYVSPTVNILDRPTNVTVTNSSGAMVAQTLNCYDYAGGCGGSSFVDAGSITNHDTNFGSSYTFRGDLTQTQRLTSGSSYLTKSMTYDTAGQLLATTDWSNLSSHTTSYSYTDRYVNDNTTNSEPLSGYSPSQATDGYPTTVTAPISSESMTYTYYYGTGQRSSATDANGKTSYWHFGDSLDRPTSTKLPPTALGIGWTYFVYPYGAKTPIDKGTGITSPALTISCTGTGDCRHDQTQLDTLGRTSHQLLVNDPDGQSTVDTGYDSNGRLSSVSNPHRTIAQTTDGTELYPSYDGLDRKLQVTRPDNSITHIYYGVAVSTNGGRSSQLCSGYGIGYPILSKDEAGRFRQSWTDGFGRLIEVDEPDPSTGSLTSGAYAGTCYAYDLNDNLIGVSSLGGSESTCTLNGAIYNRCFTYDMTSRLLTAYNPEAGTVTYTYDQDTNCQSPNSFPGQLVSKTDARGNRSCMQYDNLNRVTQNNYPGSTTPTITYSYDSTNCLDLSVSCYNLNRRTGMTDGSGQTNWAYDAVGNVLEHKQTIGTITKKIFYTYNLDGSVATILYPSGRTVTYQPGDAQRPLSAVDSTNSINYATLAHYAPPGGLASLTNGGSFNFTAIYNNRLQPCWEYTTTGTALQWNSTNTSFCTTSATTGSVLDLKFNFNWGSSDNGNVMGTTNNRDNTRSQAFTYDYLNRILIAETTSTYSTSPTNCWAEQYGIDAVANLKSVAPPTGNNNYNGCVQESGLSISVTGRNQISGFCYDAAGNLLAQSPSPCPSPTYAYDSESRLTSTAGVTYTYDGEGKRVMKSNGTLYWYGAGGDTLAETDASGNATNEYIYFVGKRIARRDSSGNVFYYFADQLGTAREMVQAGSTSPCYDADFYPFGGERIAKDGQGHPIDSCDSHFKFTGKERDTESGLDNFGARYDSSQLARFMTLDWSATPTGVPYAQLADPQSLNLYAYVRNNPLYSADPDGHSCDLCRKIQDLISAGLDPSVAIYAANNNPPQPDTAAQGAAISAGAMLANDGAVRGNYAQQASELTGPEASAARTALQQDAYQQLSPFGQGVTDALKPSRAGQLAGKTAAELAESASSTNAVINVVGQGAKVAGPALLAVGAGVSVYHVASAPAGQRGRTIASEGGAWAGALGLGFLGAKGGAVVGSFFGPGPGTAIGAGIGGLAGGAIGAIGGSKIGRTIYDHF